MENIFIKQITLRKLFDSNDIDLKFKNKVQILYGKNGTGKTTILNIINLILSGNILELSAIIFQSIEVIFSNGSKIEIFKANDNNTIAKRSNEFEKRNLIFNIKMEDGKSEKTFFPFPPATPNYIPFVEKYFEDDIRHWKHERPTRLNTNKKSLYLIKKKNKLYYTFLKKISPIFVETQRLQHSDFSDDMQNEIHKSTVEKYSKKLSHTLSKIYSDFADLSQELDSTFLNRLLDKSFNQSYNKEIIRGLLKNFETLKSSLENSGIISETNVVSFDIDTITKEDEKPIYLHLKDAIEKHRVYANFEKKLSLFLKIINKKFEDSKTVSFSRMEGFQILTKNKKKLDPQYLSSGEQHEIVLLYKLIFEKEKNQIVLIDEPEISLHIDWQMSFLDDLDSINELSTHQIIIATHSPSIIGNRIDLCQAVL